MRSFRFSSWRSDSRFIVYSILVGSLSLAGCASGSRPLFTKLSEFGQQSRDFATRLLPHKEKPLEEDVFLKQIAEDQSEREKQTKEKSALAAKQEASDKLASSNTEAKSYTSSKVRLPLFDSLSRPGKTDTNEIQESEIQESDSVFSELVPGEHVSSELPKDPFLDQIKQIQFENETRSTNESQATFERELSSDLASAERVSDQAGLNPFDSFRKTNTSDNDNRFVDGFDARLEQLKAQIEKNRNTSSSNVSTSAESRTTQDFPLNSQAPVGVKTEKELSFSEWLVSGSSQHSSTIQEFDEQPASQAKVYLPSKRSDRVTEQQVVEPVQAGAGVAETTPSGLQFGTPTQNRPASSAHTIPQTANVNNRTTQQISPPAENIPVVADRYKQHRVTPDQQSSRNELPEIHARKIDRSESTLNYSDGEFTDMIVDTASLQSDWSRKVISLTAATVSDATSVWDPTPGPELIPIRNSQQLDRFQALASTEGSLENQSGFVRSNEAASLHTRDMAPAPPEDAELTGEALLESQFMDSKESLAPIEWELEPEIVEEEPTPVVPFVMIAAIVISIIAGTVYRLRSGRDVRNISMKRS